MHLLSRRTLLQATLLGLTSAAAMQRRAEAAMRKMKITRIRFYECAQSRAMTNQSFHIVTVETDAGLTGIGEGGSADLMKQMAHQLIGQDPTRIEYLWQHMYRGFFYPAGREKLHALGALDLALWDLKGKALDVPVWQLLGGAARDHMECYATAYPDKGGVRASAKACIAEGYRAYRTHPADPQGNNVYDVKHMVNATFELCKEIREGVGPKADWAIDYHTRFDFPEAVRLSTLLEPLEPYFVEDLVRSENPGVYKQLRPMVKVPIAVGEQFGDKWDINELVEGRLIDYSRVSLPNSGGITEFMKHAALCETHYVGLVPHFTGPLSEAALVHCCMVASGPVLMEVAALGLVPFPHLPKHFDFRNGKMWPNERPGLGVLFNPAVPTIKPIWEVTQADQPVPILRRPDGSVTNW